MTMTMQEPHQFNHTGPLPPVHFHTDQDQVRQEHPRWNVMGRNQCHCTPAWMSFWDHQMVEMTIRLLFMMLTIHLSTCTLCALRLPQHQCTKLSEMGNS